MTVVVVIRIVISSYIWQLALVRLFHLYGPVDYRAGPNLHRSGPVEKMSILCISD